MPVVDYVGVLVFPHPQDLINDQLLLRLLLQIHLVYGRLRERERDRERRRERETQRKIPESEWVLIAMKVCTDKEFTLAGRCIH